MPMLLLASARDLTRRAATSGFAVALLVTGPACGSDSVAPAEADDLYIEVQVTGGFAAADFRFAVDGRAGAVRGITCVNLCNFEPGEVIVHLSPAQVLGLSELLREAGMLELGDTDFGVQCCDQFHYTILFRDGDREATVRGSSEALPDGLRAAAVRLHGLLQGIVPIIVDFESRPADWPRDALALRSHSLDGPILTLEVEYTGGCQAHEVDLVAWGGWLESFPVQVNLQLSHESHDDPCEALIMRELRFDLQPLRQSYEAVYGSGEPGATTIVLRLAAPDGGDARRIDYTF